MNTKKILKIIAWIFSALVLVVLCFYAYYNYLLKHQHIPNNGEVSHSADYIDPKKALLNEGFKVCNENFIVQYYNPETATYSEGKNGLRKFVLSNYKNNNYTDSGYLNIRFVINCKGEAGRYIIHENNLDLEPHNFDKDLVSQLFKITAQLKKWNPNFVHDEYRDSYMYISYRIENGNITEILP